MLGSIASLRSIATQARDSLDAAETLANSVVFSEASGHTEASKRRKRDRLDAAEAEEVLDEEYAPLMGDSEHEGSRATSSKGRPEDSDGLESPEEFVDSSPRVRKLEMVITYVAFFVLGATILLPWHSLLISTTYSGARLRGTPFEQSYVSFIAVVFTTANCAFLAHANYSQSGARPSHRIFLSIAVIGSCNLLLALSTRVAAFQPTAFFVVLMAIVVLQAAAGSYLQNAVVALSSVFGPTYLQGILSGQGAIGVAVATVQLVSAIGSALASPSVDAEEDRPVGFAEPGLRTSAFAFFLIGMAFALVALGFHFLVTRLAFYQLVVVAEGGVGLEGSKPRSSHPDHDDEDDDGEDSRSLLGSTVRPSSSPTIRSVERKVRVLGIAVFYVFAITLAVFPAVTNTVVSYSSAEPDPPLWADTFVFVSIHFLVFAIGDWIGRAMPQVPALVFTKTWTLFVASMARTLFVPVFLFCNISTSNDTGPRTVLIRSDALYMILLLVFAMSNGYVSTLVMIAGVSKPTLRKDEIDIAATVLAFYLTIGLAIGSFSSFAIRALLCGCNPFLQ